MMTLDEIEDKIATVRQLAYEMPERAFHEAEQAQEHLFLDHASRAADLEELFDLLQYQTALLNAVPRQYRHALGISSSGFIEGLPVFSDDEPVDTIGVWSYDDDNLIMGEGWGQWEMVERDDY